MKYCVENNLAVFEFHDSFFSFLSFDGSNLVLSASRVNIHKDTPWNPSDCDMEIDSAQIVFKNFHAATYEPDRVWETGADGKSYLVGPRVIFSGQDAMDRILAELQNEIAVYYFSQKEGGTGYSIGGNGIEPYFEMEFDFDAVTVAWDEYKKKAWYELHRQYQYDAVLRTPEGDETVNLRVGCNEEKLYFGGSFEVTVGCTFRGKDYWGRGKDDLWIDAFAGLQKRLPEGVQLACCLTCRHGNLCPVGNAENEVFCTKDVVITQKSDLYFYTEDEGERRKRAKQSCDLCEDYEPQTDEYYTYNDYLIYLKDR